MCSCPTTRELATPRSRSTEGVAFTSSGFQRVAIGIAHDQARVDRRWLRDTIDERIAGGLTRALGPVGGLRSKLDFGSDGPGGLVLEGVFTFPEYRGAGLASRLVATCLHRAPATVCLHVGMHNAPARAAYERAGMTLAGRCRLLLLA